MGLGGASGAVLAGAVITTSTPPALGSIAIEGAMLRTPTMLLILITTVIDTYQNIDYTR